MLKARGFKQYILKDIRYLDLIRIKIEQRYCMFLNYKPFKECPNTDYLTKLDLLPNPKQDLLARIRELHRQRVGQKENALQIEKYKKSPHSTLIVHPENL